MRQILEGTKFMHSKGVSHRDLKPENILINEEGVFKICDFGSAKYITEDSVNSPYIVSRFYRAPELILAYDDYCEKVDIWALGCIFAELVLLKPLFPGKAEGSQFIEQVCILGRPSEKIMMKMSKKMEKERVEII